MGLSISSQERDKKGYSMILLQEALRDKDRIEKSRINQRGNASHHQQSVTRLAELM